MKSEAGEENNWRRQGFYETITWFLMTPIILPKPNEGVRQI